MKIIIGVDPSTLGYHEICTINAETLETLDSVKKKGNQATIATIQDLTARYHDIYDDLTLVVGIEYQNNLLRDTAQALEYPVYPGQRPG